MKKTILSIVLSLSVFVATGGHSDEWRDFAAASYCEEPCSECETNFYAKIFGGANFLQGSKIQGNRAHYRAGYLFAGSLGFSWCYGLHVEAEYAFRRNSLKQIRFFDNENAKHGHFQSSSYMGNLYWDFPLRMLCNIQPFIGAGAGYDVQQMHSSNSRVIFKQDWNRFSWQVMGGLACPLHCHADITLEYRFHQGGCHFNNHTVGAGFVYKM